MFWAWPQTVQGREMRQGPVTLMNLKTIARPLAREFTHQPITLGLGQDRSCTDGGDLGIAPDDGASRKG
jgi:hypothetical protein